MLTALKLSTPGKRIWSYGSQYDSEVNYNMTIRSTFPIWSKFFYVQTPKRERSKYLETNSCKPWEDGYFNGNTREFIQMLENAINGKLPKTDRQKAAFHQAVEGYIDEMKEFEEMYNS